VQHLSAIHQKSNLDALDNGDDGKRSTGSLRPNPTYPTLASLEEMFEDQNISTAVIDRLKRYDKNARRAKANSMDPRELVPTRFVFKEPSGTRNTRVAHRLARLYFDLGLLGSSDILECKISSMISERSGQVGQHLRSKLPITTLTHVFHQTRNNTAATINKAQGRLLLVRGIHELNTTPRKNIDELVEVLSSVAELAQLVVVFAG
jgi:hypothetical protein